MNWQSEAASVRTGKRAPANLHLMLHVVMHEDRTTEVGPSIEDPFEPARNLGMSATSSGLQRLREELTRADGLLRGDSDLAVLLEPWAPPERGEGGGSGRGEGGGSGAASGGSAPAAHSSDEEA